MDERLLCEQAIESKEYRGTRETGRDEGGGGGNIQKKGWIQLVSFYLVNRERI